MIRQFAQYAVVHGGKTSIDDLKDVLRKWDSGIGYEIMAKHSAETPLPGEMDDEEYVRIILEKGISAVEQLRRMSEAHAKGEGPRPTMPDFVERNPDGPHNKVLFDLFDSIGLPWH